MTFQITLRPTGRFETVEGRECRIWQGETPAGTKVEAYIALIRSPSGENQAELEAALREVKAERQLVAFDTRML
jgi:hypothetical protein